MTIYLEEWEVEINLVVGMLSISLNPHRDAEMRRPSSVIGKDAC
jgi:hypothetical protein